MVKKHKHENKKRNHEKKFMEGAFAYAMDKTFTENWFKQ